MKTEKEKMLTSEYFNPLDKQLSDDRLAARKLLHELNHNSPEEFQQQKEITRKLLPNSSKATFIQPPFYCDYGYNIKAGKGVFFNFNCTLLDLGSIEIGTKTMIGPNVQIYTAVHPKNAEKRATGIEKGNPIRIGKNVWIGGNTTICPGVTIGDNSIIGAGSVVTKDIAANVMAAGNPCRVIKELLNETKSLS
ncbi:sugar O-acetyltransferase [Mesonia aestuariivivens]|uniref:Acetyltransferase n=1 Tax=Mesonia aestuariivivens TaxID=2796128 RepID=A0ABS6VYC7_9FLAO|nr:sugar O-acetyltransferase [Mesonia aestuariivivens]MBW2960590.1 sugar O-acetyltransferase [Mesonia aestuariivivens]